MNWNYRIWNLCTWDHKLQGQTKSISILDYFMMLMEQEIGV